MIMRRFSDMFALASAVALSVISCAKESEDHVNDGTKNKITITASLPDELVTKVKFEAGESVIKPSWEQTDVIRIISETGKSETYSIKEINGNTATFEGNELEGTSFTAIYPGNYESVEALGNRSYTGQVQKGNGSTAHLQLNAMATGLSDISNISFADAGAKLNGAVKLYVKMPEYVTSPTEVSLSAASDIFFTDNAGSAKSSSLGLSLENVDISADHIFTAYLMSSWTEASIETGTKLTLTVKAEGVSIKKSFTVEKSVNLAGGHLNTIQLNAENWNTVLEGAGTESDPYRLSATRDLLAMKAALVKGQMTYFKLMNDIDMSSIENWDPLNPDEPYDLGIVFDGGGHSLKNLKSKGQVYSSFFGVLYGKCYNVKFVDAEIVSASNSGAAIIGGYIGTGGKPAIVSEVEASGIITCNGKGQSVGGLGGNAREATIENCTVNVTVSNPMGDGSNRTATGGVVGKTIDSAVKIKNCIVRGVVEITKGINNTYTGGIVGWQSAAGAEITGCEVYATVKSAGERVGGIVGHYQGGTLSGCKFYGEVNAATQFAGGIAGISGGVASIKSCMVSGEIEGVENCGGIIGKNENKLTVEDCIFSGKLKGFQRLGGIVGDLLSSSSVKRCFVSGAVDGWGCIGGVVGRACNGGWAAAGSDYGNNIESCIVWLDNITATRPASDTNTKASSGAVVGFTATKNVLKDCLRKSGMKLTAEFYSNIYDQENAGPSNPLVISEPSVSADYIVYPYHGKAAEASATTTSLAQSLGWNADIWNLSGPEPKLK